jgi:Kef-type K+ transport system membrane component KefB
VLLIKKRCAGGVVQLLLREWPNVIALLAGLIAIKTAIITAIGPRVGLSLSESVRTGLLLSQGGEFAFVVFSLANRYITYNSFSLQSPQSENPETFL